MSPEDEGTYLQALTVLALTVSWSFTSIFIVAVGTAALPRLSATELIPSVYLAQFWKCFVRLLQENEKKKTKVKQSQRMSDQRNWSYKTLLFRVPWKRSRTDQITGVQHRATHCSLGECLGFCSALPSPPHDISISVNVSCGKEWFNSIHGKQKDSTSGSITARFSEGCYVFFMQYNSWCKAWKVLRYTQRGTYFMTPKWFPNCIH